LFGGKGMSSHYSSRSSIRAARAARVAWLAAASSNF
jgi:hypothetical protein